MPALHSLKAVETGARANLQSKAEAAHEASAQLGIQT